jgi:hypothetical protein
MVRRTEKIPITGFQIWVELKALHKEGCSTGRNFSISGKTKAEVIRNLKIKLNEIESESIRVLEW